MDVGMVLQVLPPGVKHGEETDLRSEMFRIAGNREKGFRSGAEENAVDDLLVVESDTGQFFRNREYDVEVLTLIAAIQVTLSPDKRGARFCGAIHGRNLA